MGLEVIFGIAIVAFLILYFALNLQLDVDSHVFLRYLSFLFFFILLVLLAKATFDQKDDCIQFIQNATVDQNVTSYEYDYHCTATSKNTASTFYTTMVWLLRLFITYVLGYILYFAGKKMLEKFRGRM